MKKVHLIVVGKLKDKRIEALEQDFLQRINSLELQIHELKAKAQDKAFEGKLILKKIEEISKISPPLVVALTEAGQERDSRNFSKWLFEKLETSRQLVFIIAGAEGFERGVLNASQEKLSLSKLTFPHKLARLLFIEQIYRAITIKENHPYHN
ncbi:MAG: 23S rRNA (pseudouridine(1915)-N(3))-methyltransferase RlmH [Bacteriovoracaceae bacterium]